MHKNLIKAFILGLISSTWYFCHAQIISTFEPLHQHETIYSTSLDHLMITTGISDPLRSGASYVIQYVSGARYSGQIDNFEEASEITLTFISSVINRFLGLLALVALIYLLYHAFMVLISYNSEEKISEHRSAIYTAAIVIIGIWLSWVVVSGMFYLVSIITG